MFLAAPLPPPYWTGFDVAVQPDRIRPLGFLLACLALLRTGWTRGGVVAAGRFAAVAP